MPDLVHVEPDPETGALITRPFTAEESAAREALATSAAGRLVTLALAAPQQRTVDPAAIGAALDALPADQPLTKADLAPLLALFGASAGPA